MFACDRNLGITAFPGLSNYKPLLKYIDEGTNACICQFSPGWPFREGNTVGTTPLDPKVQWPPRPGSEEYNLHAIYELYGHKRNASRRDRLTMKMQPGQKLSETPQYKTLGDNVTTCPGLFEAICQAVLEDAKGYIAEYGCIHAGDAEMNDGNVLFEFDAANKKPTAYPINWAKADCSFGNKPSTVAKAILLCQDYVIATHSPIKDCGTKFTFQGAKDFCKGLK
ncbi:hypothetical protein BDM02DRAFT_3271525 [Thelephora ganbajun]|uniref:Uncharacterized protein n=1 Tax=Thelephora ganbajun TaxID=370292 RepID=A0ACB6Z805_THEGA|nr:hypothetical protein BDM02DRAFT_3271525 [Thelephora ganbajun]